MKNAMTVLTALGLLLSTGTMAQTTVHPVATKNRINTEQSGTRVVPVPGSIGKQAIPAGSDTRTNQEITLKKMAEERRIREKNLSPQLKDADGVIRIDFGVAKQGETFSAFLPFNIVTLEGKVNLTTPVLDQKDYVRYTSLYQPSGVKDVKLANDGKFRRGTAVASGNGFNLEYNADQPGAIDEAILVYTKKGNIVYRLTGYVVGKDTEVTVKR